MRTRYPALLAVIRLCSRIRPTAASLLIALAFALDAVPAAAQTGSSQSVTYTLKSGVADGGGVDLLTWVQGSASPRLGTASSGLPLQPAFLIPRQGGWATLEDARWIGPSRTGAGVPEGYEYFAFFAVPPGFRAVSLDLLWRADDASEAAINGNPLPARGGHFAPQNPVGEFHGEISSLVTVGMNRLQFFVENARVGVNPTGLIFVARITLSRVFQGRTISAVVGGLSPGPFHPDRTRVWHAHRDNPILLPEGDLEMQAGEGNIYAPDVHRTGDVWLMFYGGQGRDGHDRIFTAESADGIFWQRLQGGKPLIDVAREGRGAVHVMDPSAVRVNGRTHVFYSRAPGDGTDLIDHFVDGQADLSVIPLGTPGAWDSFAVARPSVLFENGLYKIWYDGIASLRTDRRRPNFAAGRHVGFATSPDGVRWTPHPSNPILLNSGAVDVEHIGDWYVLVQESEVGTQWALGRTETDLKHQGLLFPISGERYDRYGHVTPHLYVEGNRLLAVYYGAAEGKDGIPAAAWNRNRIAVSFLQKEIVVRTPDGNAILTESLAVDSDRVEVRLPETWRGKPLVFEVISEDGRTSLARSAPIVMQRDLSLRFTGTGIGRS